MRRPLQSHFDELLLGWERLSEAVRHLKEDVVAVGEALVRGLLREAVGVDVRVLSVEVPEIVGHLFCHSNLEEHRKRLPSIKLLLAVLVHVQNAATQSFGARDSLVRELPDVHVGE